MISIKFTEASKFQNSYLDKIFQFPIAKSHYFVGRGQQLQEKQSQAYGIIDLTNFDNTLSRVHAEINFSPAWFYKNQSKIPSYLEMIKIKNEHLPLDVINKIWQYFKPKKNSIVKDLKSKLGIFRQVFNQQIQSQMIIQFVYQAQIKFEYEQKYQTLEQLQQRVKYFQQNKQQKTIIFGNLNKIRQHYNNLQKDNDKSQLLKIWILSVKQTKYILLREEQLMLRIGRSSHCQIQIKDTAISRYQAYLKCQNKKWRIIDGNPLQKSKNGTWKKQKVIQLSVSTNQNYLIKNYIKIGTIKCEIEVNDQFSWLNLNKIANGDISKSFIELGINKQQELKCTQHYDLIQ